MPEQKGGPVAEGVKNKRDRRDKGEVTSAKHGGGPHQLSRGEAKHVVDP